MEQQIYLLKITLADSEPEVWRHVLVPASVTLAGLHEIVQRAMGWESLHDYRFALGVGQAPCDVQLRLEEAIASSKTLYYTYDFKSGWLHRIEVDSEAVDIDATDLDAARSASGSQDLPLCTGGASACPPEGSGGVWGYDELLARLENPDDPDYLDLIDKYSSFDPDKFDITAANQRLSHHTA